jgi:hypothetical protein
MMAAVAAMHGMTSRWEPAHHSAQRANPSFLFWTFLRCPSPPLAFIFFLQCDQDFPSATQGAQLDAQGIIEVAMCEL